jgi:hypothetical protein
VLIANDDGFNWGVNALPANSPLLHGTGSDFDAEIYRVVPHPGTYYLEVSAPEGAEDASSVGGYQVELTVARPGLEGERAGKHQILFVDFDGAGPIAWREYASAGPLSPLADSCRAST